MVLSVLIDSAIVTLEAIPLITLIRLERADKLTEKERVDAVAGLAQTRQTN